MKKNWIWRTKKNNVKVGTVPIDFKVQKLYFKDLNQNYHFSCLVCSICPESRKEMWRKYLLFNFERIFENFYPAFLLTILCSWVYSFSYLFRGKTRIKILYWQSKFTLMFQFLCNLNWTNLFFQPSSVFYFFVCFIFILVKKYDINKKKSHKKFRQS